METFTPSTAILAKRILSIRLERFGQGRSGLQALADRLSIPPQTWENYEAGVSMPGCLMVGFLVATRANPTWLTTGEGPRFLTEESWESKIAESE